MSRRQNHRAGNTNDDEPYQNPEFPLNDAARATLGQLSRSNQTLQYKTQLTESCRSLSQSTYDLQARLQSQRSRLQKLQSTRASKGITEKTPEEERLESHIPSLEERVAHLTSESEHYVRSAIDQRARLEDTATVLGQMFTAPQPPSSANQEDQDTKPQITGILPTFQSSITRLLDAHASSTPQQLYATDNDYKNFKKSWYDGLAGDDGPPLPDASKWFRSDGTPVMGISLDELGEEDGDSDDDIAVAREVRSNNCPLTLRTLEQPYTSRKCGHTFEKSAILDYLRNNGRPVPVQCPQTGCSLMLSISQFDHNFFLDQAVMRRIERANMANVDDEMDADIEAEPEVENSVTEMAVRNQRPRQRRDMKQET